jgi:hypothetical protein
MRALSLCLALGIFGCGPSSAQIKEAKSAQYEAAPNQIMDIALQVAQQTYKIGPIDVQNHRFSTEPQWYSAEGGRISPTNEGGGDFVNAGGGSVNLTLIVEAVEISAGQVVVTVTPKTLQLVDGSPQPRELKPEDPNLPPWVLGRADKLQLEIHQQAKRYIDKP